MDAERLAGLAFERIFSAEPAKDFALGLVISADICVVVGREQAAEFKPVHEFADGRGHGKNLFVRGLGKCGIVGGKSCLLHGLILHGADPPVQDQGKRTALRLRLCGQVSDQLPVRGQALAVCALQTALRGEIRVRHDEAAVHNIVADGLQKKAFAAAVAAHDKAEGRAALGNDFHIAEQGLDFMFPADRDVGQTDTGNDAALE